MRFLCLLACFMLKNCGGISTGREDMLQLFALASAVMEKGEWFQYVLISDTNIITGAIPVSTFDCSATFSALQSTHINNRTSGDFVNYVIDCPRSDVIQFFTTANSTNSRRSEDIFYNFLILGTEVTHHDSFLSTLLEGDNIVNIYPDFIQNGTFITYTIQRCLINCYENGSMSTLLVGVADPSNITESAEVFLPAVFSGFGGRTIDVTFAGSSTSIYIKETTIAGVLHLSGIEIEVLNVLGAMFNFSYRMSEPPDKTYGTLNEETGQWTGMIGVLQRKEAELAVGGISATYQRQEVVDFIYPYKNVVSAIHYRTDPQAARTTYFLDAVSWDMWLAILLTPLTVAALTFVILWVDPNIKPRTGKQFTPESVFTIFFDAYSALFPQNLGKFQNCQMLSFRLLLGSYLFLMVVIVTLYVGNLIAVLAIPQIKHPFSSIEELAARDDFALLVDKGSGSTFLRESRNPKLQLLWEKVVREPEKSYVSARRTTFLRYPLGFKVASFDSISGLDRYMRIRGVCSVARLPETYFPRSVSIAVRKSTPYLKHFDRAIMRMLEAGFFIKWNEVYLPKQSCSKDEGSQRTVSLQDVSVLMSIVAGGLAAAFLAMLLELCSRFLFGQIKSYTLKRLKPKF